MKKLFAVILSLGLIIAPVPVVSTAHAMDMSVIKNQIVTLVTSTVGANIIVSCPLSGMHPSMMIFMAGSATHIMTEIMAGKDLKKVQAKNDAEIEALKSEMKEGGDLQKKVIQENLESEENKLKFVNKRLKWLNLVSMMYVGATIAAIAEGVREIVSMGAYTSDAACTGLGGAVSAITYKAVVAAFTYGNFKAAGNTMMGLLQSVGFLFLPVHASMVPALYRNAWTRIATFGAATIFVKMVMGDLNKIKTKLEENIAKLNAMLNQFNNDTKTDNELEEGYVAGKGQLGDKNPDGTNRTYALKALPKAELNERECLSRGPNGAMTMSSSGCKNPVKLQKPRFDASFNIPALTDFSNGAIDMANTLASGDIGAAEVQAGQLASQASRLQTMRDDAAKKLNEKLKESGKKFDIDGEIKKRYEAMSAEVDKAASSAGVSLADASGGESSVSETPAKDESASAINSVATAPVTPNAVTDVDLSSIGAGGVEEVVDPNANQVASLDESLNDFESNESDISKDPGVSIFKQVSNRYFLNYTKIFQRKEIAPPLAEPKPAN